jgi:CDP-glucose 4,6-dehydratase
MVLSNPDPVFWAGKRVFLTGHTGFKGAWLTTWLASLNARVFGFSLPPNTSPSLFSLVAAGIGSSVFGDIRDLDTVRHRLNEAEPEVIFHLAAQSLVRPSYADPVGTYATNVMGTVHVLEAARACPSVRAVVIVTSDKVYENREWIWPYREDEALGGYDPYSSSKGAAELVANAYRRSFFKEGAHVATARAGNVIGGGDWSQDRLVPDIIRAFASDKIVTIRSPNAIRPWQHVLEPLNGYLLLAQKLSQGGDKFASAWNFGPNESDCRPVSHLVEEMARCWGSDASWQLESEVQPHEAGYLKVDSSKAKAELGWDRRLNLDSALAWTADWYRHQMRGHDVKDFTLGQINAYTALGL